MSATNTWPRVETIVVPNSIRTEHIGKYVSAKAHTILADIGLGAIVPRSARLSPLGNHVYLLSFDAQTSYSLPKTLDLEGPDSTEPGDVEEVSEMAEGAEDRPFKRGKTGASR